MQVVVSTFGTGIGKSISLALSGDETTLSAAISYDAPMVHPAP